MTLTINKDFSYKIYPGKGHSSGRHEIVGEIKNLAATVTAEEIGKAVVGALEEAEMYEKEHKAEEKYPTKSLELLDGSTLIVKRPKDKHFMDCEDSGAAEIYQCYSYFPQDGAESSADFFLGIAPELDCNLESENVCNAWEDIYGKADFFEIQGVDQGIFEIRAEMRNKNVHKISYFLQMEEDLIHAKQRAKCELARIWRLTRGC